MTKVLKRKKQNKSPKSRSKNMLLDQRLKAIAPGKRMTDWGTIYYEKRENRSDKDSKQYPYL